jgi:hypothetical protein
VTSFRTQFFESAGLSDFGEACFLSEDSEDGQQFSLTELCPPSLLKADKKFSG